MKRSEGRKKTENFPGMREERKFSLRVGFPLIDQMIMFTHTENKARTGEKAGGRGGRRRVKDENLSQRGKKSIKCEASMM